MTSLRLGPGGIPVMLGHAGTGETSFIVPAAITFNPGVLYQL